MTEVISQEYMWLGSKIEGLSQRRWLSLQYWIILEVAKSSPCTEIPIMSSDRVSNQRWRSPEIIVKSFQNLPLDAKDTGAGLDTCGPYKILGNPIGPVNGA